MQATVTPIQLASKKSKQDENGEPIEKHTVVGYCLLFGPDSDKIAKILNIPRSYRTENGWILSSSKRRKAIKLGAEEWHVEDS